MTARPAPASANRAAGLAAAQEHAADVGVEDAVPLGLVEVDEVDLPSDAGVVDQHVDATEGRVCSVEEFGDRLRVRDVGLLHERHAAGGLDALAGRLQRVQRTARQHDAHVGGSDLAGDRLPQTPACTCYHGHTTRHDSNMSDI